MKERKQTMNGQEMLSTIEYLRLLRARIIEESRTNLTAFNFIRRRRADRLIQRIDDEIRNLCDVVEIWYRDCE